jgi:hypothetical protein
VEKETQKLSQAEQFSRPVDELFFLLFFPRLSSLSVFQKNFIKFKKKYPKNFPGSRPGFLLPLLASIIFTYHFIKKFHVLNNFLLNRLRSLFTHTFLFIIFFITHKNYPAPGGKKKGCANISYLLAH